MAAAMIAAAATGLLWQPATSQGAVGPADVAGWRPGERIRIDDAAATPNLAIVGRHFAPAITIDASGAMFESILIRDSSGIRLIGAQVNGSTRRAVQVERSRDIMLHDLSIVGRTGGADPRDETGVAVTIRGSTQVSLTHSHIEHVSNIAAVRDSRGVVIAENSFDRAREGIMTTNAQGLLYTRNRFARWAPRYDLLEHPDMMQFFTRNGTAASSFVRIHANGLMAGDNRPVQGIFARSEDAESGASPDALHHHFSIRHNVYHGSSLHGISLTSVRDAVVEHNSVIASANGFVRPEYVDPAGLWRTGYVAAILVGSGTSGRFAYNIAPALSLRPGAGVTDIEGNAISRPRTGVEASRAGGCLITPLTNPFPLPSAFVMRESCQHRGVQQGARVTGWGRPERANLDTALAYHRHASRLLDEVAAGAWLDAK